MYWPKFDIKKLHKLVRADRRKLKSGSSCFYVKWTKYVGLKCYSARDCRNHSISLQRRAAEAGLAPRVGEHLDLEILTLDSFSEAPELYIKKIYCYWTEHADTSRRTTKQQRIDLVHSLWDAGVHHFDMHHLNTAFKGKKPVTIDFDADSCDYSYGEKPYDIEEGAF